MVTIIINDSLLGFVVVVFGVSAMLGSCIGQLITEQEDVIDKAFAPQTLKCKRLKFLSYHVLLPPSTRMYYFENGTTENLLAMEIPYI